MSTLAFDWFSRLGQALQPNRRAARGKGKPSAQQAFEQALQTPPPMLRMSVLDGRHRGATETFALPRVLIGSSADCDALITDTGVQGQHLEVRHANGRWVVRDLPTGAEMPLQASGSRRRESMLVACGPVRLRFDAESPVSRPGHRRARNTLMVAAATGTALTVALVTGVYWEQAWSMPAPEQLVAGSSDSLQKAGFPEVRVDLTKAGRLELVGFVTDEYQLKELTSWQQRSAYRDATPNVLVISRLIDRIKQDFGAEGLKLVYLGRGQIRVEGSTRRVELKQRLHDFTANFQGRLLLDDRVAYIDEAAKPVGKPRSLPFRIVNVMVGEASYFRTDSGATYFVGSALPDGAVVLSIDESRVVFRQGNTEVVYPLG